MAMKKGGSKKPFSDTDIQFANAYDYNVKGDIAGLDFNDWVGEPEMTGSTPAGMSPFNDREVDDLQGLGKNYHGGDLQANNPDL